MSHAPAENLTDHEYDGIKEYDNPTPGWWTWLFAFSIVFSLGYMVYYHIGTVSSNVYQHYDAAVAANVRQQFATLGDLEADEPTVLKMMNDPQWLKVGQMTFAGNCVSCHGANAAGLVGPNLVDDHWKNVRSLTDIAKVINDGAAAGAMPAWKTRLHPNDVVLLTAYIASLRGTTVEGPSRPAEGEVIAPWPAPPAAQP